MLELALAFVMVLLSLGLLGGFVALVSYDFGFWGNGRDVHRDFDAVLVKAVVFASLVAAVGLLGYLWALLLKYYRYEAHTLRPLKENETVPPGDGRDKNEG